MEHTSHRWPPPGSPEELAAFARLQDRLPEQFRRIFSDDRAPRTVVVIPSLSLDPDELKKIPGVMHYEERMLCLLMLLRLPRTRLVYVTSTEVSPAIIDYYLHLLPGVPSAHARARLNLFDCGDPSVRPLTAKILDQPDMVERIAQAIPDRAAAHLTCFASTPLERTLAVRLGIPVYASDPELAYLGSKTGGRRLLRQVGVPIPDGFEGLRDEHDLVTALVDMRGRNPALRRAVVKLNEGFSGEGNALFDYALAPETSSGLRQWVRRALPSILHFEATGESWERYRDKLATMGGIAEEFLEAPERRSPSVQCRINPLGEIELVSSHDQVLGGPNDQVFVGCRFPAEPWYLAEITDMARAVARAMASHDVLGRFGVDFVSVPAEGGWASYAIEVNLRKGGTTLPFLMLQFLTGGSYRADDGLYELPLGGHRYYYASDNVQESAYRGLTPTDLIDFMVYEGLHFDAATQQGVVFHLMGALPDVGKLGVVAIADRPEAAERAFDRVVETLDKAVGYQPGAGS